jgi:DNA-binding CsgD family transcriptional regulator
MFPTNIERIQNLLYSILRQYSPNHIEDFTHREIEVLLMMLRGDSATEIGEKFNLSGERIRQIWRNILHRLESTRNLIEIQKEEIEKLKDKILQLEKTKDRFIENTPYYTIPEEILDNLDLLLQPVSAQSFSTRTKRGLDKAHINTVWDLVQFDPKRIRYGLQYMGLKTFNEIEQWLAEHNLKFGLTLPVGVDIMQVKQEVSLNMLDITKK